MAHFTPSRKKSEKTVWNLTREKGHGAEQRADVTFPVLDLGPAYAVGGWLDTAAVVSQLDLVVSPDSAIAHVAGALARPVWIALCRRSEWRWMRQRDYSQWYPSPAALPPRPAR